VGPDVDNRAYDALIAQAKDAGVRVFHRHESERFQFGEADGTILWPKASNESGAPANNDSVVLKIRDGRVRFLLTGDVEQKTEKTLVADGAPLAAEFLKVPHHGSKTSSTAGFLAAVAPRAAVISVGEGNSFGQPFPDVLERYAQAGIRLLRTDLDGAVTASTDGQTLTVTAFREKPQSGEKFAAK
jgi:competence protein ComEC